MSQSSPLNPNDDVRWPNTPGLGKEVRRLNDCLERQDRASDEEAARDSEARLRDFHNRLRVLMGIDLGELEEAGLQMSSDDWVSFRDHPWRWFIRARDDQAAKVWSIIERRAVR